MAGKDFFAGLRVEFGKVARRRAEQDVAVLKLGEAYVVQDFGHWKQVVDFELQCARDLPNQPCRYRVVRQRSLSIQL